jgi:hypothetical protein
MKVPYLIMISAGLIKNVNWWMLWRCYCDATEAAIRNGEIGKRTGYIIGSHQGQIKNSCRIKQDWLRPFSMNAQEGLIYLNS